MPVPFVDERCAEFLFRKNVLDLFKDEPEDSAAVKRLARYILRLPVSLERMAWAERSTGIPNPLLPSRPAEGPSDRSRLEAQKGNRHGS